MCDWLTLTAPRYNGEGFRGGYNSSTVVYILLEIPDIDVDV